MYYIFIYIFSIQYFNITVKHAHTHRKTQEKHTVRSIWSSTWSPSVGIYDGSLVKVNARSYVQAFS